MTPSHIERARVHIAAASTASDLAPYHVAAARAALDAASDELRSVEVLVVAREREIARVAAPKPQLARAEVGT